MKQRVRAILLRAGIACLCSLTLLGQGAWLWHAYAQNGTSEAARILQSTRRAHNATTQRPSAFRRLLMGTRQPPAAPGKTLRLFNTMEFKAPLANMPQWERIMKSMGKATDALSRHLPDTGPASARSAWTTFRDSLHGASLMDKLRRVNARFNQYPYRLDQDVWGKSDYWATPAEFAARSGDCEDYAIIKYYALKELGVAPDSMRIVALKDTIRNIGHAVLVVYAQHTAWVLDNQTDLVLPHERYGHYLPQYSVNETNRWAHVPLR